MLLLGKARPELLLFEWMEAMRGLVRGLLLLMSLPAPSDPWMRPPCVLYKHEHGIDLLRLTDT